MRGEGPSILVAGASWPPRRSCIAGRDGEGPQPAAEFSRWTPPFISESLGAPVWVAVTILLLNVYQLRHRVIWEGTFLETQSLSPGYELLMLLMSNC